MNVWHTREAGGEEEAAAVGETPRLLRQHCCFSPPSTPVVVVMLLAPVEAAEAVVAGAVGGARGPLRAAEYGSALYPTASPQRSETSIASQVTLFDATCAAPGHSGGHAHDHTFFSATCSATVPSAPRIDAHARPSLPHTVAKEGSRTVIATWVLRFDATFAGYEVVSSRLDACPRFERGEDVDTRSSLRPCPAAPVLLPLELPFDVLTSPSVVPPVRLVACAPGAPVWPAGGTVTPPRSRAFSA